MSRSRYLAAIADPRAGNAGKRRRLTVLLPPRRLYGIEPARPLDEMAAGQLSGSEAPRPHARSAMDPAAPEGTAPSAVSTLPRLDAATTSAFAPLPARVADRVRSEYPAPARSWPDDLGIGHAEPNRAVGVPRDSARPPAAGRWAPRMDHMTEPGPPAAPSAAAHLIEASIARVPLPMAPSTAEPARHIVAPSASAAPASEQAHDSATPRKPTPHRASAIPLARPAPTVLAPPTRAVTDHERARPREREPARHAPREPRVHIGTIDLTVVPPPVPVAPGTPAPLRVARTVPADAPLSRGPGRWFGVGQR